MRLIETSLRKDNCLYSSHADGIVSLDLDFKLQFGNSAETCVLKVKMFEPVVKTVSPICSSQGCWISQAYSLEGIWMTQTGCMKISGGLLIIFDL